MKREVKLVILVFLLVVGPAVLLSLFAVRVLNNWQVVLQKRMETEAARVLDQAVAAWQAELGRNTPHPGPLPQGERAGVRGISSPWITGVFIFTPGVGLVYPPADSKTSSFVPGAPLSDDAARAAALLQHAEALRATGETNEAVECLRKVAGERRTSNIEHSTLNIERGGEKAPEGSQLDVERPTSNIEHSTLNIERGGAKALEGSQLDVERSMFNVGRSFLPDGKKFPRDPDEGFYYDLIALKLLGDIDEARHRVLERYDDLVPLQRDLMVEWIEGEQSRIQYSVFRIQNSESGSQKTSFLNNSTTQQPNNLLLHTAWRERMRGRALTEADRARLAAEIAGLAPSLPENGWIRARVGGRERGDALVGRYSAPSGAGGKMGGPEDRQAGIEESGILVVQFDEVELIRRLNEVVSRVAANSGIRVEASAARLQAPEARRRESSFILQTARLPAPFETIILEALPADPREFSANARLQSRLYGWGGALLFISVMAGAWVIWRQAAGEIREARERTDFAAVVSHDLRTPLASMRMLAESLYMGNVADDAKKQTFLGAILKESDRLSRLTDRALYFIRYGQGALRYQFTEGDLGSLVKDVVETFSVGIAANLEKGDIEQKSQSPRREEIFISAGGGKEDSSFANFATSVHHSSSPVVRLAIDQGLPLVRFDAGAMEQVVSNLLDNAVKYSDKSKGVRVEVALVAREGRRRVFGRRSAGDVVLSVKDHGVGMAPDDVRRVLKPYIRGRGAAKQNARGIGLGLALCHHVVRAHGGRIEIESEPGAGTTFSIILPAA